MAWRPANLASKLTDQANKPAATFTGKLVRVAYNYGQGIVFGEEWPHEFATKFRYEPSTGCHGTSGKYSCVISVSKAAQITISRPARHSSSPTRILCSGPPANRCASRGRASTCPRTPHAGKDNTLLPPDHRPCRDNYEAGRGHLGFKQRTKRKAILAVGRLFPLRGA